MNISLKPRQYMPIVLFLLTFFLLFQPNEVVARKYAALVMDAQTGEVLHSRQARAKRHPASITKVMTLYMLFDAIRAGRFTMETGLKVSRKATQASPSKLGLGRGTRIKVKDAIGTLITKSANDVAVVVAEAIAGSERDFATLMTKKARAIGMKNTTFRNASGLHHRNQVTTAHDIAILAQRMRKDFPEHYSKFKMRYYTFRKQKYYNHNKLLGRYPGMEGLKTGFINASGFNLVAVAKRNGQRVITIVFGGRTGPSRDKQVRKLMDLGFSRLPDMSVIEAPRRQDILLAVAKPAKPAKVVPKAPRRVSENNITSTGDNNKKNIITNPALQQLDQQQVDAEDVYTLIDITDMEKEAITDVKEESVELLFTVIE